MIQLSHPHMTTRKIIALTIWTFVVKVMSLLFNMLSMFVIVFPPRSKNLLISWHIQLSVRLWTQARGLQNPCSQSLSYWWRPRVNPRRGICDRKEKQRKGEGDVHKNDKGKSPTHNWASKNDKIWVCLNTSGKHFPVVWKFGWKSNQYREKLSKQIQINY